MPSIPKVDRNSARIYGIVAREARRAVIFRRGPSGRVRLLLWHLKDDTLEAGQWFKGRIYERRCDLTPAGDKLIYFAASYHKPLYSWTAISKPPYLTALALWPKGDCWGGGGLFDDSEHVRLNHFHHGIRLAEGFTLPPNLTVSPLGDHSGRGEDEPIAGTRRRRDGSVDIPTCSAREYHGFEGPYGFTFSPPEAAQKALGEQLILRTHLHALFERRGRAYVETADLMTRMGKSIFEFGRIDWADLDHNGDVLYAKDGCLFRLSKPARPHDADRLIPRLVADLNDMVFEPIEAPDWAQRWN